tara:strand:- start:350 stop:874 length:525 start_codon:yes stop_codon:yes gene_type:complete
MKEETFNVYYPKVIMMVFAIIGLIFKIFLGAIIGSNENLGQASLDVWSNLIIIFALISYMSIDKVIITNNGLMIQIFIFIIVLLWQTSLSIRYKERINKKTVPSIYNTWKYFLNILIFSFIILFCYKIAYNVNSGGELNEINYILYLIVSLSIIIIAIQQTILDNFMVDKDTIR